MVWNVDVFVKMANGFEHFLGGGFKYFLFHPYLGKIPILIIFSIGLKPPTSFEYTSTTQMEEKHFATLILRSLLPRCSKEQYTKNSSSNKVLEYDCWDITKFTKQNS